VILYQLLAGRKPYSLASKSLAEIVRTVCQEEPPAPAAINRLLAGDLDAIIRKSIRKEPDQRYGSAEELGRELERYLAGDPVTASGLSFPYLASKYVARHKSQTATVAAAAVLLLAGIVGVTWEARIANRERIAAERRFDNLRALASEMVFETNHNLAQYPGTTEARKALIARGLRYLDFLAKDSVRDPSLQRDLGAAYVRMGDIQGKPGEPNVGDLEGAVASYRKASAILLAVLEKNPSDFEAQLNLVDAYQDLSYCYGYMGDRAERDKAVQQASRAAEDAVHRYPANRRARMTLASAYFAQALAFDLPKSEATVEAWRKCLGVYQSLLSDNPQGNAELRNVALVHKYLSEVFLDLGRNGEGLEEASQAERADSKRLSAHPSDRGIQLDLTYDLNQSAAAYEAMGDIPKALDRYRRVLEIRLKLSQADPKDSAKRERLLYSQSVVAGALIELGRFAEAGKQLRAAEALGAELSAAEPANKIVREMVARIYVTHGELADGLRRPGEACSWLRRAMAQDPDLASGQESTPPWYQPVPARLAACRGNR
jgi:eukaryotic-like serine/threonine-protein kinase